MTEYETYESVWDAIADTPGEAANLKARADLMRQIEVIVRSNGWTQAEAAKQCGVTQPRINELLHGRIARFSFDALVNIAAALGQKIRVSLEAASVPTADLYYRRGAWRVETSN